MDLEPPPLPDPLTKLTSLIRSWGMSQDAVSEIGSGRDGLPGSSSPGSAVQHHQGGHQSPSHGQSGTCSAGHAHPSLGFLRSIPSLAGEVLVVFTWLAHADAAESKLSARTNKTERVILNLYLHPLATPWSHRRSAGRVLLRSTLGTGSP